MAAERSQQVVFFEDALPSVFHATPGDFLFYLERDGNKFLRFYWDRVGKGFVEPERMEAFGLNYIIRKPQNDTTIAIILMPAPQKIGEAYYEAFIYRPRRVTPILMINDSTSVFALIMTNPIGENDNTTIVERTRKGEAIDHGEGPAPIVEDFYKVVLELIRDSRGNL
jgi:hypothetical protein